MSATHKHEPSTDELAYDTDEERFGRQDADLPQEVVLRSRTYSFTTEGAEELSALRTLGTLYNSRDQFAGYVVEEKATGRRQLLGGPRGIPALEERRELAKLRA